MRAHAKRRPASTRDASWWPSRKWWAATVVGAGTVGTAWAEAGHWSASLTVTAIGLAVQRFTAWALPNKADA